jgi:hypothetical protein
MQFRNMVSARIPLLASVMPASAQSASEDEQLRQNLQAALATHPGPRRSEVDTRGRLVYGSVKREGLGRKFWLRRLRLGACSYGATGDAS